jgi:replicative DNA helicase
MTAAFDLCTDFCTREPESAFVGLLLHLPAVRAVKACRELRPEDFADPRLRVIVSTAAALAGRGVDPEPAAVLAECRTTGTVQGSNRLGVVSKLLLDLYTGAPAAAQASYYRQAVLEGALRRRITEAGERIAQAADESAVDHLLDLADREHRAIIAAAERWRKASAGRPR